MAGGSSGTDPPALHARRRSPAASTAYRAHCRCRLGSGAATQREETTMRNLLYSVAKLLGDANAVKRGKVGRRVGRRAAGKASGKGLGKLFG
jgi:hypothetical protein